MGSLRDSNLSSWRRGLLASDRALLRVATVMIWASGAALMGLILLVVADVFGVKVLSKAVPGGIEYVSFLAVLVTSLGVLYTQRRGGHVAVDFVVLKVSPKAKAIIEALTGILAVGLFAVLTYYGFKYAMSLRASGEVSMTQRIPFYPFVLVMSVCFAFMCIELFKTLLLGRTPMSMKD